MEAKSEQKAWILEEDAAEQLGVSRDAMREFRKGLTARTDWRKTGRVIEISESAFLALKKKVGGEDAPEGADEPLEAATPQAEPVPLIAHQAPRLNPRILVAKKEGADALVRVRVRSNVNFLPGMKIMARPVPGFDDVFVLEGRCPRYRGRM